jgi:hypothetical protein
MKFTVYLTPLFVRVQTQFHQNSDKILRQTLPQERTMVCGQWNIVKDRDEKIKLLVSCEVDTWLVEKIELFPVGIYLVKYHITLFSASLRSGPQYYHQSPPPSFYGTTSLAQANRARWLSSWAGQG